MIDYAMAKAALNMATMTLHNAFADKARAQHPLRAPGLDAHQRGQRRSAAAALHEHAQTLLDLFESKRTDKTGPVFVDYTGKTLSMVIKQEENKHV